MRDRMERLVVLPFSIGCVSQSSIAVCENHPKKTKQEPDTLSTRECLSSGRMKTSLGGFQRLMKGLKNFSQLFAYKEEEEDVKMDLEIGFPTDVKHVTHIGWDGSNTTNTTMKGWDDIKAPDLLSFTPISLRQFELAMSAQSDAVPLAHGSSIRLT